MLIKFTAQNGETHGGYKWPLPKKNADGTWTPGKWTRKIKGELEACENGYHYTDSEWGAGWIDREMYEIEIDGESISATDTPIKHICRRARLLRKIEAWDEKSARLFAVRCARDAMLLVPGEQQDPRSINAINVAERFANSEASSGELAAARDAARDAAWATARAAAWGAAWDAARGAVWAAARGAVWAAARAAARDAVWAAARDAAKDAVWAAALQKYSKWLLEAIGE